MLYCLFSSPCFNNFPFVYTEKQLFPYISASTSSLKATKWVSDQQNYSGINPILIIKLISSSYIQCKDQKLQIWEVYSIPSSPLLWQLLDDNSQKSIYFRSIQWPLWFQVSITDSLNIYRHPSNPTLWQQLYIALCVYKELIIKLLLHSNCLNLHRSIKVLDRLWTVPPFPN